LAIALSSDQLHELARHGAQARLQEIRDEVAAIKALAGGSSSAASDGRSRRRGRKRGTLSAAGRKAISAAQKARWAKARKGKSAGGRTRKGMSAAARKAVGDRMRKYWAAKRAAQKKTAKK
jgi:hypothetical protein